jgi:hypothetical protein
MAKHTFVLDETTAEMIRTLAERQQKPQSHIVREAVAVYAAHGQKLTAEERERKLQVLDHLARRRATQSGRDVDAELREIRRGRRSGWRRPSDR